MTYAEIKKRIAKLSYSNRRRMYDLMVKDPTQATPSKLIKYYNIVNS